MGSYNKYSFFKYNWLVNIIHERALSNAIKKYSKGILLDIGCGEKPFESITKGLVSTHIGLDHLLTLHNKDKVNLFATSYATSIAENSIDTVLCTVVLEHLENPQEAISEMYRVLKPGGFVILTTPLFWHLHEEPRDFYRYTKHGLSYLFKSSGFDFIEITPLSGFIVTFTQELVYYLNYLRRGILKYPIVLLQGFLQLLAYGLNRLDRSYKFTWAYLVVAKK